MEQLQRRHACSLSSLGKGKMSPTPLVQGGVQPTWYDRIGEVQSCQCPLASSSSAKFGTDQGKGRSVEKKVLQETEPGLLP